VELVPELVIADAIADLEEMARWRSTGEESEIGAKREVRIARV